MSHHGHSNKDDPMDSHVTAPRQSTVIPPHIQRALSSSSMMCGDNNTYHPGVTNTKNNTKNNNNPIFLNTHDDDDQCRNSSVLYNSITGNTTFTSQHPHLNSRAQANNLPNSASKTNLPSFVMNKLYNHSSHTSAGVVPRHLPNAVDGGSVHVHRLPGNELSRRKSFLLPTSQSSLFNSTNDLLDNSHQPRQPPRLTNTRNNITKPLDDSHLPRPNSSSTNTRSPSNPLLQQQQLQRQQTQQTQQQNLNTTPSRQSSSSKRPTALPGSGFTGVMGRSPKFFMFILTILLFLLSGERIWSFFSSSNNLPWLLVYLLLIIMFLFFSSPFRAGRQDETHFDEMHQMYIGGWIGESGSSSYYPAPLPPEPTPETLTTLTEIPPHLQVPSAPLEQQLLSLLHTKHAESIDDINQLQQKQNELQRIFQTEREQRPPTTYLNISFLYGLWLFIAIFLLHFPIHTQLGINPMDMVSNGIVLYISSLVALCAYHLSYFFFARSMFYLFPVFTKRLFLFPKQTLIRTLSIGELWQLNSVALSISILCSITFFHCSDAIIDPLREFVSPLSLLAREYYNALSTLSAHKALPIESSFFRSILPQQTAEILSNLSVFSTISSLTALELQTSAFFSMIHLPHKQKPTFHETTDRFTSTNENIDDEHKHFFSFDNNITKKNTSSSSSSFRPTEIEWVSLDDPIDTPRRFIADNNLKVQKDVDPSIVPSWCIYVPYLNLNPSEQLRYEYQPDDNNDNIDVDDDSEAYDTYDEKHNDGSDGNNHGEETSFFIYHQNDDGHDEKNNDEPSDNITNISKDPYHTLSPSTASLKRSSSDIYPGEPVPKRLKEGCDNTNGGKSHKIKNQKKKHKSPFFGDRIIETFDSMVPDSITKLYNKTVQSVSRYIPAFHKTILTQTDHKDTANDGNDQGGEKNDNKHFKQLPLSLQKQLQEFQSSQRQRHISSDTTINNNNNHQVVPLSRYPTRLYCLSPSQSLLTEVNFQQQQYKFPLTSPTQHGSKDSQSSQKAQHSILNPHQPYLKTFSYLFTQQSIRQPAMMYYTPLSGAIIQPLSTSLLAVTPIDRHNPRHDLEQTNLSLSPPSPNLYDPAFSTVLSSYFLPQFRPTTLPKISKIVSDRICTVFQGKPSSKFHSFWRLFSLYSAPSSSQQQQQQHHNQQYNANSIKFPLVKPITITAAGNNTNTTPHHPSPPPTPLPQSHYKSEFVDASDLFQFLEAQSPKGKGPDSFNCLSSDFIQMTSDLLSYHNRHYSISMPSDSHGYDALEHLKASFETARANFPGLLNLFSDSTVSVPDRILPDRTSKENLPLSKVDALDIDYHRNYNDKINWPGVENKILFSSQNSNETQSNRYTNSSNTEYEGIFAPLTHKLNLLYSSNTTRWLKNHLLASMPRRFINVAFGSSFDSKDIETSQHHTKATTSHSQTSSHKPQNNPNNPNPSTPSPPRLHIFPSWSRLNPLVNVVLAAFHTMATLEPIDFPLMGSKTLYHFTAIADVPAQVDHNYLFSSLPLSTPPWLKVTLSSIVHTGVLLGGILYDLVWGLVWDSHRIPYISWNNSSTSIPSSSTPSLLTTSRSISAYDQDDDVISSTFILWLTCMLIYIINYNLERSSIWTISQAHKNVDRISQRVQTSASRNRIRKLQYNLSNEKLAKIRSLETLFLPRGNFPTLSTTNSISPTRYNNNPKNDNSATFTPPTLQASPSSSSLLFTQYEPSQNNDLTDTQSCNMTHIASVNTDLHNTSTNPTFYLPTIAKGPKSSGLLAAAMKRSVLLQQQAATKSSYQYPVVPVVKTPNELQSLLYQYAVPGLNTYYARHSLLFPPFYHPGDKPLFLPMVSWYSIIELKQTLFDLFIEMKLMSGRRERRSELISNWKLYNDYNHQMILVLRSKLVNLFQSWLQIKLELINNHQLVVDDMLQLMSLGRYIPLDIDTQWNKKVEAQNKINSVLHQNIGLHWFIANYLTEFYFNQIKDCGVVNPVTFTAVLALLPTFIDQSQNFMQFMLLHPPKQTDLQRHHNVTTSQSYLPLASTQPIQSTLPLHPLPLSQSNRTVGYNPIVATTLFSNNTGTNSMTTIPSATTPIDSRCTSTGIGFDNNDIGTLTTGANGMISQPIPINIDDVVSQQPNSNNHHHISPPSLSSSSPSQSFNNTVPLANIVNAAPPHDNLKIPVAMTAPIALPQSQQQQQEYQQPLQQSHNDINANCIVSNANNNIANQQVGATISPIHEALLMTRPETQYYMRNIIAPTLADGLFKHNSNNHNIHNNNGNIDTYPLSPQRPIDTLSLFPTQQDYQNQQQNNHSSQYPTTQNSSNIESIIQQRLEQYNNDLIQHINTSFENQYKTLNNNLFVTASELFTNCSISDGTHFSFAKDQTFKSNDYLKSINNIQKKNILEQNTPTSPLASVTAQSPESTLESDVNTANNPLINSNPTQSPTPILIHPISTQPVQNIEPFWFDVMADTGDGGDPTYNIARLLAQPWLDIPLPPPPPPVPVVGNIIPLQSPDNPQEITRCSKFLQFSINSWVKSTGILKTLWCGRNDEIDHQIEGPKRVSEGLVENLVKQSHHLLVLHPHSMHSLDLKVENDPANKGNEDGNGFPSSSQHQSVQQGDQMDTKPPLTTTQSAILTGFSNNSHTSTKSTTSGIPSSGPITPNLSRPTSLSPASPSPINNFENNNNNINKNKDIKPSSEIKHGVNLTNLYCPFCLYERSSQKKQLIFATNIKKKLGLIDKKFFTEGVHAFFDQKVRPLHEDSNNNIVDNNNNNNNNNTNNNNNNISSTPVVANNIVGGYNNGIPPTKHQHHGHNANARVSFASRVQLRQGAELEDNKSYDGYDEISSNHHLDLDQMIDSISEDFNDGSDKGNHFHLDDNIDLSSSPTSSSLSSLNSIDVSERTNHLDVLSLPGIDAQASSHLYSSTNNILNNSNSTLRLTSSHLPQPLLQQNPPQSSLLDPTDPRNKKHHNNQEQPQQADLSKLPHLPPHPISPTPLITQHFEVSGYNSTRGPVPLARGSSQFQPDHTEIRTPQSPSSQFGLFLQSPQTTLNQQQQQQSQQLPSTTSQPFLFTPTKTPQNSRIIPTRPPHVDLLDYLQPSLEFPPATAFASLTPFHTVPIDPYFDDFDEDYVNINNSAGLRGKTPHGTPYDTVDPIQDVKQTSLLSIFDPPVLSTSPLLSSVTIQQPPVQLGHSQDPTQVQATHEGVTGILNSRGNAINNQSSTRISLNINDNDNFLISTNDSGVGDTNSPIINSIGHHQQVQQLETMSIPISLPTRHITSSQGLPYSHREYSSYIHSSITPHPQVGDKLNNNPPTQAHRYQLDCPHRSSFTPFTSNSFLSQIQVSWRKQSAMRQFKALFNIKNHQHHQPSGSSQHHNLPNGPATTGHHRYNRNITTSTLNHNNNQLNVPTTPYSPSYDSTISLSSPSPDSQSPLSVENGHDIDIDGGRVDEDNVLDDDEHDAYATLATLLKKRFQSITNSSSQNNRNNPAGNSVRGHQDKSNENNIHKATQSATTPSNNISLTPSSISLQSSVNPDQKNMSLSPSEQADLALAVDNRTQQVQQLPNQPSPSSPQQQNLSQSPSLNQPSAPNSAPSSSTSPSLEDDNEQAYDFRLRTQRGKLMILLGDLGYPTPSTSVYEERLFRPFSYACPPPILPEYHTPHFSSPPTVAFGPHLPISLFSKQGGPQYDDPGTATQKPAIPTNMRIQDYQGPICFTIPGNHDCFSLQDYINFFVHRHYIGGWLMPQTRTFFSLELPHKVWFFGIDIGLTNDLDIHQLGYFTHIISTLPSNARVIVGQHEPQWATAPYNGIKEGVALIKFLNLVGKRLVLRIGGDIHNYIRHSRTNGTSIYNTPASSLANRNQQSTDSLQQKQLEKPPQAESSIAQPEHLIITGGGGAFLHPVFPFAIPLLYQNNTLYDYITSYPNCQQSYQVALQNIFKFRRNNWKIDVLGFILYFLLVCSMLPMCNVSDFLFAYPIRQNTRDVTPFFSSNIAPLHIDNSIASGNTNLGASVLTPSLSSNSQFSNTLDPSPIGSTKLQCDNSFHYPTTRQPYAAEYQFKQSAHQSRSQPQSVLLSSYDKHGLLRTYASHIGAQCVGLSGCEHSYIPPSPSFLALYNKPAHCSSFKLYLEHLDDNNKKDGKSVDNQNTTSQATFQSYTNNYLQKCLSRPRTRYATNHVDRPTDFSCPSNQFQHLNILSMDHHPLNFESQLPDRAKRRQIYREQQMKTSQSAVQFEPTIISSGGTKFSSHHRPPQQPSSSTATRIQLQTLVNDEIITPSSLLHWLEHLLPRWVYITILLLVRHLVLICILIYSAFINLQLSFFIIAAALVVTFCMVGQLYFHKRLLIGMAHGGAHIFAAITIAIFLNVMIELGTTHGLIGKNSAISEIHHSLTQFNDYLSTYPNEHNFDSDEDVWGMGQHNGILKGDGTKPTVPGLNKFQPKEFEIIDLHLDNNKNDHKVDKNTILQQDHIEDNNDSGLSEQDIEQSEQEQQQPQQPLRPNLDISYNQLIVLERNAYDTLSTVLPFHILKYYLGQTSSYNDGMPQSPTNSKPHTNHTNLNSGNVHHRFHQTIHDNTHLLNTSSEVKNNIYYLSKLLVSTVNSLLTSPRTYPTILPHKLPLKTQQRPSTINPPYRRYADSIFALFHTYQDFQAEQFPDQNQFQSSLQSWTFGLYPNLIKYWLLIFDFGHLNAFLHSLKCQDQCLPNIIKSGPQLNNPFLTHFPPHSSSSSLNGGSNGASVNPHHHHSDASTYASVPTQILTSGTPSDLYVNKEYIDTLLQLVITRHRLLNLAADILFKQPASPRVDNLKKTNHTITNSTTAAPSSITQDGGLVSQPYHFTPSELHSTLFESKPVQQQYQQEHTYFVPIKSTHLSGLITTLYYISFSIFFFFIATPTFALVVAIYLTTAVYFFNLGWDEAFSAVRSQSYKHWCRFLIDANGTIHCYVLGVERTPKNWTQDKHWSFISIQDQYQKLSARYTALLTSLQSTLQLAQLTKQSQMGLLLDDVSLLNVVDKETLTELQSMYRELKSLHHHLYQSYTHMRPSRWVPTETDQVQIVDYFTIASRQ